MTTVTGEMMARGHEQVVFVTDVASGLRAIIAVHSTALGPALGGVRFWHYEREEDALLDVLRLSEAMTLKASIAGLHQGGGKVVVLLDAVDAPHPEPMLLALGRAIDELGGRYLAAEDVGATQGDMDVIARETPWVTGVAPTAGGSGDPSPVTALGVLAAIRAVAQALDGAPDISGYRVAVQGAGHVGAHLVADLAAAGASVVVADVNDVRAHEVAVAHGAEVVVSDDILAVECDVFAPCALGGVLSEAAVPLLRCRAVCGAANNQLADDHVDDLLYERGVLYGPDFVANAGGIINIAEEFTGYSRDRALARAEAIEGTMTRVLERARAEDRGPGGVAEDIARERIAREGSSNRWHPGDPAAWTNGQPLTRLRPAHAQPGHLQLGSSS
ncbi:MAG: Glu/Leu/Phe/Val dehydrogenase [Acidimicrobiia bacterium]|nr:Glu/Leu/Phe/Val dehydrogenase [Acidimicrobiia bacterium]